MSANPSSTLAVVRSSADLTTVDQLEAERITGLSEKTLERHHKAGEASGRIKLGRRVLFVRDALEAWIRSKLPAN